MRLSNKMQAMYDQLRESPAGVTRDSGFTRATANALVRRGLADLTVEMEDLTVVRRTTGKRANRAVAVWTLHMKPVMPTPEEVQDLDLAALNGESAMPPVRRRQAASYVALAPVDREGAEPAGYDASAVYRSAFAMDTERLMVSYVAMRTMVTTGAVAPPPDPADQLGEQTDVWVATDEDGTELTRVRSPDEMGAKMQVNGLLNQRGGYEIRRLFESEVGPWIKDFRAANVILRVSSDAENEFVVTDVESGSVLVIRTTAAEVERDARANVRSLLDALV